MPRPWRRKLPALDPFKRRRNKQSHKSAALVFGIHDATWTAPYTAPPSPCHAPPRSAPQSVGLARPGWAPLSLSSYMRAHFHPQSRQAWPGRGQPGFRYLSRQWPTPGLPQAKWHCVTQQHGPTGPASPDNELRTASTPPLAHCNETCDANVALGREFQLVCRAEKSLFVARPWVNYKI